MRLHQRATLSTGDKNMAQTSLRMRVRQITAGTNFVIFAVYTSMLFPYYRIQSN